MKTDEQVIKFINITMDSIHDRCNDLYEALMDREYDSVEYIIKDINNILKDLTQTFKDEI